MFEKIKLIYYYVFKFPIYKFKFGSIGIGSKLFSPILEGTKNIFIGKDVYIRKNTWLASVPVTGENKSQLIIGDGSYIGHFCHIYASKKIEIGKKVLLADRVYISDNLHDYKNIHLPIISQPILQIATVKIDDGAWLGENACIIGASIGKNSVIGANSVVTKDIPDYAVAVGAPAKIIKRFNFDNNVWQKTDAEGNFI
jgi:acetyltransferase-like isoleucine patch superfamily enzyme